MLDTDEIGRSGITSWVALGDGSVYAWSKPTGSGTVFVRKWPIQMDQELLGLLSARQEAPRPTG